VEQRAGPSVWQYIDPSRDTPKAKYKYTMELRLYDRTIDNLQDISAFVHSTITVNNLTYILQNKKTVHEMLEALRQKFASTDKARDFELLSRYRTLFTWKKNQDIDVWLDA
jgi:5-carboxymethyl-2-hydroxymuconate isomerase